ncbi:MAG: pimeloyl-ACP methyl ester carboxylesterase [Bacteroidia bacterium]|jgi:pimeloyl-ACP methyl ester carboxylesterase
MSKTREYHIDVGGTDLAVIEWPGSGDPILLLHATGFHKRCWNEVVLRLPGRHVYAADLRYHGNSGSEGQVQWSVMAQDVCQLLEKLDLHNVIGVGHSMGGQLLARAAARHPERFRHLVLIDPVIMDPARHASLAQLRANFSASDHPVSRRRNRWRDAQEMYERFRERPPFDTWQPAVLKDYCDYALRPKDEEEWQQLACDPINEAAIYMHHEDNQSIYEELDRIRTPVTLLRAPSGDSTVPDFTLSPTWPALASALRDCREVYLPHLNHFIPMQDPELVAQHILALN